MYQRVGFWRSRKHEIDETFCIKIRKEIIHPNHDTCAFVGAVKRNARILEAVCRERIRASLLPSPPCALAGSLSHLLKTSPSYVRKMHARAAPRVARHHSPYAGPLANSSPQFPIPIPPDQPTRSPTSQHPNLPPRPPSALPHPPAAAASLSNSPLTQQANKAPTSAPLLHASHTSAAARPQGAHALGSR